MRPAFNERQRKAFRDAKESEYANLADGDYQSVLEEVTAKAFGANAEQKVMLKYKVFDPIEHDGLTYTQFQSLENPNTMGILKVILRKFGINSDEIELDDVVPKLQKCVGDEVHFTLKTTTAKNGKDYQNSTIKSVFRSDEGKKDQNIPNDDGDIPFSLALTLATGGILASLFPWFSQMGGLA